MNNFTKRFANKRIFLYTAYFDVLYFFEIINLMFLLLILYGKFVSVFSGIILTILLSIQIIRIYFGNSLNRKIQIYLMDIHLAYSIPFFLSLIVSGFNSGWLDFIFILLRFVIFCAEIFLIHVLTDEVLTDCVET